MNDDGPEFRHLRYFIAVAEERSFSRAARRLRVAQPSLSTQIRLLEEGLNAKLFTRTSAGTVLTAAGVALLPLAKQMLVMRRQAVEQTSLANAGLKQPFRFGYSPWINHQVVHETIAGYTELVPGATIEPSSQSSGPLIRMVMDGELNAALINLPVDSDGLYSQVVCSERLLICMREDDPLAQEESVPRAALQERLRIMFDRDLHPLLYDYIEEKFGKAGIKLRPTEFVSHPAEMQFLIKEGHGFGLVRDGVDLDPALVRRPVAGLKLSIRGAFVCRISQETPVLPLLAFRVAKFCSDQPQFNTSRKPVGKVHPPNFGQAKLFG